MPDRQDVDGNHHGHKLQQRKVNLVCAHFALHALGRLGQAEDGAQVDERGGNPDRCDEELDRPRGLADHVARPIAEQAKEDAEDEEGEALETQAAKEDVVGGGRVFIVGFSCADERCAGNLDDRCNDVADDKGDDDAARRQNR